MLISLLTDFGLADTYVGQLKGAILSICRAASLIDVTHAVPSQDIFGGAFLLWSAVEALPAGSVHLAVVDPGVGSARRPIAARAARGDVLVGPDNGLLWPALDRLGGCSAAVELRDARYWRVAEPSATFHGRDIFGPVAAHLALGVPLDTLGPAIDHLVRLELPHPDGPRGEVLHVDVYGNLVTNFSSNRLPANYEVRLGERKIAPAPSYAAAADNALLAVVGSAGLLEISARNASAAKLTGARRGTPVEVVSR